MAKKKPAMIINADTKTITLNVPRTKLTGDDLALYQDMIAVGYVPKQARKQSSKQKANAAKIKKKDDYLEYLTDKEQREQFLNLMETKGFLVAAHWANDLNTDK